MRIGAIFPQLEIGTDPALLKDYAQAVEGLGYTHLLAYDHVLGAGTATRPDWRGPYSSASLFHEPFVLFGYLAGLTSRLEFVTGVIILPQRQTALLAKQAAEVDVLSGGRFRLGVGVGWNTVEYEALGENFHDRGARSAEQIRLLRRLFTEEVVDFRGRWHRVDNAGINPLPVQRPIPIWLGGSSEATLKRIARLGDGWFPQRPPDDEARGMLERLRGYTRDAGRDPALIGIEARLSIGQVPEDRWAGTVAAWRDLGATHFGVNTMGAGLPSPQAHIDALRRVKAALGV
ncbi:MAG TPA: LLM class F420-dependent oxidoreductase [Thermomicrobiales bacterium]|nr:LLM class F420-dependent oxidoreductase [Thermomicrobiales bacterium]